MFEDATAFNQILTAWDVSSVTDMSLMFSRAGVFNQALAAWEASSATNMKYMFEYASAFNQVLCWDMSRVTYTSDMFTGSGTTYEAALNYPVCPLIPITNSESLRTAIGAWCEDSTQAAETYGDISTWCVC
jgi:surface protein